MSTAPSSAMRFATFALGTAMLTATASAQPAELKPLIGRWDMTVVSPERSAPSWLEVTLSGNRTLVGRFVADGGSARPISRVEFAAGNVRFQLPPQWDRGNDDLKFEGRLSGDQLSGTMTSASGERLTWTARRAPLIRRASPPVWGVPVTLFGGKDLSFWRTTPGNSQWSVVNGVLTNAKAGANLVTTTTFSDFKLHVEFRYPKSGNSGVYLRGRYEVQVEDSGGQEPTLVSLGAIYGFLAANEDVAKSAGEWQTYDITLIGRLVTVVLNGTSIITNQLIPGITGGALDSDESAPGPIYLQGDHSAVEYRNIVITPAKQRVRERDGRPTGTEHD